MLGLGRLGDNDAADLVHLLRVALVGHVREEQHLDVAQPRLHRERRRRIRHGRREVRVLLAVQ
jgi:hypothetical protein